MVTFSKTMSSWETIIGLEVHAQASTKTKMFCACDNDAFGKPPNTTVCPICMGHPGALPVPNAEALEKAMRAALALKAEISKEHHLDRKNYFYPDLPSGFQISQYDFPLATNGEVKFGKDQHCRIRRLHIENDAGKLMHARGHSYCDFNRAGTPLMEIVTEPDLHSGTEAVDFAKELQRILISVKASEADMYKGMMRFDASISLRPKGDPKLYPRSEIKNLNSFKALEKALEFEEKRLRELWEKKEPPTKEVTVHWDDQHEVGVILREKESAADYRYFPEPDIPPFSTNAKRLEALQKEASVLPSEKREQYIQAGFSEAEAFLLTENADLEDFYQEIYAYTKDHKRARSTVLNQLTGFLRTSEKSLQEGPSGASVITLLTLVDTGKVNANTGKQILEEMVQSGKEAKEIMEEKGLGKSMDTSALQTFIEEAMRENPKAVEDLLAGKAKAGGAIVGAVMKKASGRADPKMVQEILEKLL